jgi:two-component system chemotaxis sensor kinase CheA
MSFDPAAEIATEFSKEYQKDYKVTDPTELVEDFTNYELLAELLSQMPQEEQLKYEKAEKPKVAPVSSPTVDLPMPKFEEIPVPLFMTDGSLEDLFAQSANPNPPAIAPQAASAAPLPESPPAPTPVAPLKVVAKEKGDSSNSDGHGKPSGKAPLKGAHSVIKVDTGRVDSVLDAVGELVVLKNQLVHDETVHNGSNLRLEAIVDQLDKAVRELYEKTLSIRMTPLKSMFVKIQRIVRDLSISLDKPVDLNLIGEETEVERTVFELLGDPLVHLVRNSMDHGVENKTLRQQRGKSATSKVTVSAKQSGGNVIIEIIDDGGGINRERVLAKAIERGLVPHGVDPASLADENVFQFIFQPGFSTADKISDLSGRGVGLDVVKSNLDKINGKINIQSKAGLGTTFRLTIPLTTAITDGIIVALDGARYILPIHSIREIVRVVPKDYTHVSNAGKVANIRGHLLPVIDVSTTLGTINWALNQEGQTSDKRRDGSLSERREETMLVIIESMVGQMAFPVDDVLGQAQVVVKPISTGHYIPEVSGAAILGDGRTVLILDPSALINHVMKVSEISA